MIFVKENRIKESLSLGSIFIYDVLRNVTKFKSIRISFSTPGTKEELMTADTERATIVNTAKEIIIHPIDHVSNALFYFDKTGKVNVSSNKALDRSTGRGHYVVAQRIIDVLFVEEFEVLTGRIKIRFKGKGDLEIWL